LSDRVQFAGEEYNAIRVRLLSRKFQAWGNDIGASFDSLLRALASSRLSSRPW